MSIMWRALTSDLNEFVNTVAGDTSDVLNRMDENFPDGGKEELSLAAEERLRRMESHETFDLPLISEEDDEDYKEDVKKFLADFSIDSKTDEITTLLEENPDTLKLAFEALVPTKVSYEDFWQRYFYRCDEDRINAEIEEEEREAEAARAKRFESFSAMGTILGGAVQAVSKSLTEEKRGSGKSQFGSSGRPPFVLNTAVDEDDEEEELGWDDDDEDNGNENEDEGQIEFKDAVTETLQEQLKQALEEREQLHQTVEMQRKEIASLKTHGSENAEIESLKTLLFEKESEIAALRASVMDDSIAGEISPSHNAKVLEDKVKSLTLNVEALTKQAEASTMALDNANKETEQLKSKVTLLQASAETAKGDNAKLRTENAELRRKLEEAEKNLQMLENEAKHLEKMVRPPAKVDPGGNVETVVDQGEANAMDHGTESVESPDTISSVVKVEILDKEKEEGGWDDDW